MPDVKLPLSGDVTQTLFPWTNALTINLGQSADPAVERDALSVASYGRQLGRIGVPAHDRSIEAGRLQREANRRADQPRTDDGNPLHRAPSCFARRRCVNARARSPR